MITQLTDNWVCYAILLLAAFCYQQLSLQLLNTKLNKPFNNSNTNVDIDTNASKLEAELHFSSILIGALPLLGLLGTIIGLLDCFSAMSSNGADAQAMSAGIGDALFTTQLGLVCAIPAWLLQSSVRSRVNQLILITSANNADNANRTHSEIAS